MSDRESVYYAIHDDLFGKSNKDLRGYRAIVNGEITARTVGSNGIPTYQLHQRIEELDRKIATNEQNGDKS